MAWPTRLRAISLVLICMLGTARAQAPAPRGARPAAPAPPAATPMRETSVVRGLDPAMLDHSIDLARQYLLTAQRPDGSMIYELHAEKGVDLGTRNAVREMGGLWALAMVHRHRPTPQTAAAIAKALKHHDKHARRTKAGGRYLAEPGAPEWTTNAVALHALALLDFLGDAGSGAGDKIDPALREKCKKDLVDEIWFLLSLRLPGGRFSSTYRTSDGKGVGTPSPYADGEALLAIVRAAKHPDGDPAWRNAAL